MTHPPIRPDPSKIIVPRKHAQILIEPPLQALEAALKLPQSPASQTPRANVPTFASQPLDQLRRSAREHFLKAATEWATETDAPPPAADALDKPWILTGHQVEFYHAGVWAKVIAADELARRTGGLAFDILVDHDTIDHLGFDVPVQHGDLWKREAIHWANSPGLPADALSAPTPEQFEKWDTNLAFHLHSHTDSLAFLLAALHPQSKIENQKSKIAYAPWLSRARAKLEQALELNVHHVPASLLCSSDTWRLFVQAWIDNAEVWTQTYNTHLAAYRKRQGIKNPHHPMPDLARTAAGGATTYELPFWIYEIGQPRQRLFIKKTPTQTTLLHDNFEHPLTSEFRILNSEFVIRPRALTLTMYTRLFLADIFVHGIGGALYDQITDAILEDLFHVAPPYACVSAAWLLPLGLPLEAIDDIPHLKSLRHHVQHNPQQAIDPFTALKTDVAELILARKNLIEHITASLAAHRTDKAATLQRREWFRELHAVNETLHAKAPNILTNLDRQLAEAITAREQNQVLLWREYFFGLHTMDSLQQLISKVRGSE